MVRREYGTALVLTASMRLGAAARGRVLSPRRTSDDVMFEVCKALQVHEEGRYIIAERITRSPGESHVV